MNRRLWIIVAVLIIVGAATTWWALRVPTVLGVRATQREVIELLVATGRLAAHQSSDLGFEVGGILTERLVEEGDLVTSGQVLARLDRSEIVSLVAQAEAAAVVAEREFDRVRRPALAEDLERTQAAVAAAQASLTQAQLDLERLTRLGDIGIPAERDAAATRLEQARANGRQAAAEFARLVRQPLAEEVALATAQVSEKRAALAHTQTQAARRELRAPYAGVILARFADPGVALSPGSAVLRLAESGRPEILVDTDEGNLGRLAIGQKASVTAQGFPGRSFTATLERIGPGVDSKRGVVPLRLIPTAVPDWARIDMTIDVSIETARLPTAITVPPSAVVEREGIAWVVSENSGRAKFIKITIRGRGRDGLALEGLTLNTVVALNAAGITDGQRLHLAPSP
jgi:HlyD family secretion protein